MTNILGWLILIAVCMVGFLAVDHVVGRRREQAEIRREKRSGMTPPAGYNFQYDYNHQLAKIVHDQSMTMSQMAVTLEKILNTLKGIDKKLTQEVKDGRPDKELQQDGNSVPLKRGLAYLSQADREDTGSA